MDKDLMHNYEDLTDLNTVGDVFDEVRKLRKAINAHRVATQNQLRQREDEILYHCLPSYAGTPRQSDLKLAIEITSPVDHEIVGEGV